MWKMEEGKGEEAELDLSHRVWSKGEGTYRGNTSGRGLSKYARMKGAIKPFTHPLPRHLLGRRRSEEKRGGRRRKVRTRGGGSTASV